MMLKQRVEAEARINVVEADKDNGVDAEIRDENEREWAGNYLSRFRYHIFLPKTGAGAGKAVAKMVAEYMGIRKRTHTNEYSTKTDGSRTAAGCTHHTFTQAHCSCGPSFFCSDMHTSHGHTYLRTHNDKVVVA